MSTTLYPGIAFSPQAVLTDNIGAADTIIPVSDAAAFPNAPNLATIGTDEEGETILYTAKTATALSGCQRGVEGAAKSWQAGELIGRNFTAKDHADLIAAVQEAAKTAEAGGVAFDDGETFQEKYDSGELVGPVGKTGATGEAGPTGPAGKSAYQYAVDGGYTGTEAQFKALLNDIPNKQPKLTGTAGQVVGFGADGAAVAVRGWSNPNLLDNWYFADPINQRGQTEYIGPKYTIDRWRIETGAKLEALEGGVVFSPNPSKYNIFVQDIENYKDLIGKELTLSILIEENTCNNCVLWFYGGTMDNFVILLLNDVEKLYSVTMTPNSNITYLRCGVQGRNTSGSLKIKGVKLELGSKQTLAHQDASGNWVLNDPPPNKALELAKCQRYLVPLNKWQKFTIVEVYGSGIDFVVPVPTAMRANPAIVGLENLSDVSGTISFNDFEFRVVSSGPALCCRLQKSNHGLTLDQIKAIQVKELSFLDANL